MTSADEKYSIGSTTDISNLSDGNIHFVMIEYLPGTLPGTLRVFLDNLNAPVLTVPLDLEAALRLADGTAWAGFTAATGADGENHDILSFTFGPSASSQSTFPMQLVDDAEQLEDRLRLTPAAGGKRGAAWTTSKQAVRDGFVSMFRFQITDVVRAGADGFAFIVQNWDGLALVGGGGGLGYTGMAHTLAVEFDTWMNHESNFGDPDSVGDPNDNHVSVHVPLPGLGGRFDSELPFSPGIDWEPVVAADPSSSYLYQVVTGYGRRECRQCAHPSILYRVSPDGGDSWGPVKYVCGADCRTGSNMGPGQFDPRIKVTNGGTVFVLWTNWGPGPVVARSFDHGETFTRPVIAGQSHQGWADFPHLAISPDGKDVYVASNTTDPFVVASHDGGTTFGNPVRLAPPTNKRIWFTDGGVVAPDGTVYFSISVEGPFTAGGNLGTGPVELLVAKSRDKGATWSFVTIDRSEQAPQCVVECITDEYQAQIVIDMDAAGTLFVAYMKNTLAGAPKQFFSRTSGDGATWSDPSLINAQGDSNFPLVSHGPGPGDFRVAWQDNRNGPFAWNTWLRRTTDGGRSWTEEARLSDVGSVAHYKSAAGYVFPYGDYFGLATDARGMNFLIWGEGTSRAGNGGCWYTRGE